MMKMFYILIVEVVIYVYKFAKTLQAEHLKCIHFIVCKLYFNKIGKRKPGQAEQKPTLKLLCPVSLKVVEGKQWAPRVFFVCLFVFCSTGV
jgi:hypothetical protein